MPNLAVRTAVCGLLFLVAGGNRVQAQYYDWGPSYHSSTVAESRARGMADMVRSYGQYQLKNSEAAKNYADARNQEIDNRYKYTKMYFDLKKINRQERAELRGPRPTSEQLVRFAQAGAPEPLSTSQLDPATGDISWPRALMTDDYTRQRGQIESLFAERAHQDGRLSLDQYSAVQEISSEMQTMLKSQIQAMDSATYLAAKNFLSSLAYEGR